MILRINTFFSINCRRKFHQAKVPASFVGFAMEIWSHFIFHCYFNQLRISNKYFTSPLCCPKHNSLHKKPPQQTPNPPKQNRVHYDLSRVDLQLFARELPKLWIQQAFLPLLLLGALLCHTMLNTRCMLSLPGSAHWCLKPCLVSTKKFKKFHKKTNLIFDDLIYLSFMVLHFFVFLYLAYRTIRATENPLCKFLDLVLL